MMMLKPRSFFLCFCFLCGMHSATAFEVVLNEKEEICLARKNTTAENCALKPDLVEIKALLSEMKAEILFQLQETLIKSIVCTNDSMQIKGKDCADLYMKGVRQNGVYKIDPDGKGSFNVRCDMTTSGGGWTVFQRRLDGSVDFYRGWQDYKHGFGDLKGEFWLGLDKIHRLTTASRNKLRIDLEDTSGSKRYAEYGLFAVTSERQKYQLSLGTYSGNAGDSLTRQKDMAFSTKDSDNDIYSGKCAIAYKGGWWYQVCHNSNLNGLYHHGAHSSFADGINWRAWKGYYYSLKSTAMKIRPRAFGLRA
ncbi:ryncolin-4-like isoform X1 [Dendronephthya gigantea]|uniref:ryncolin-4-like isoform X1 n=1 Tax=Dendronephthya gigantea TaxID=151771 RepID=UPI00106A0C14|nr:ryncolin-4-like isoform X1 [Dendronephthya gigantea]